MAKKNLKTSETAIIKRSEIKLNPLNPKRHSEKVIKLQKKNLQQVGFLGGIVWNRTTGNLIDGHRRIYAMDLYYGYDGKENDYDVKVEVVEMPVKAEKAQLTYMAIGNTKPEKDLIARYIGDIDKDIIPDLGFEDDELKDILAIADDNSNGMVEDALGDFLSDDDIVTEGLAKTQPHAVANHDTSTEDVVSTDTPEMDDEAKKAHVKSIKEKTERLAAARQQSENAYTILSFSTADAKAAFMDIVGCNPDAKFVKGEDVLRLIE
jgi:hypothetical protein